MVDKDNVVSYVEKTKNGFPVNATQRSFIEQDNDNFKLKKTTFELISETRSIQSYKQPTVNAKSPLIPSNTITISPNDKKSCEHNLIQKNDKKNCISINDKENKLCSQNNKDNQTNFINTKNIDIHVSEDKIKKDRNSTINGVEKIKVKKKLDANKPKAAVKGPFELDKETLINGRFVIKEKIGSGGCGAVYKCFDNIKKNYVALKAEKNIDDKGCVLKFEVKVLKHLDGKNNIVQLVSYGKKESFSWIVLTLLGHNLYDLRKACDSFSYSTIARIGIQILYALKEVHEAGFIHRDVKPQNMAIGGVVTTIKIIHLLDFGLSRGYTIINNQVTVIREKRNNVLFRGTSRYCSINAQKNMEQGRNDDLWSLLYVLSEFIQPLPWSKFGRNKLRILQAKENISTKELFPNFPQIEIISDYLDTLNYYSRPKYGIIFNVLKNMLLSKGGYMSDLYDWEIEGVVKLPKEFLKEIDIVRNELESKNKTPLVSHISKDAQKSKVSMESKISNKNNSIYKMLNNLNEFYIYEKFATSKTRF
ncbi:Asator [Strongyloides ratti]|uniref:Asator n=1 Tax=Strongyloides ratti TaxID=34506 RepID=A0A090KZL6_STRRB|nr:Asator [Strongyloides ratti]CEF62871.1 Asator [Strongyloides ratti]